jgi:hypothetical protein
MSRKDFEEVAKILSNRTREQIISGFIIYLKSKNNKFDEYKFINKINENIYK